MIHSCMQHGCARMSSSVRAPGVSISVSRGCPYASRALVLVLTTEVLSCDAVAVRAATVRVQSECPNAFASVSEYTTANLNRSTFSLMYRTPHETRPCCTACRNCN